MTPEQRAARLHYHMYETCEGIREHAERIVALEELVADMWPHVRHRSAMCDACDMADECASSDQPCLLYGPLEDRMRGLGVMDE